MKKSAANFQFLLLLVLFMVGGFDKVQSQTTSPQGAVATYKNYVLQSLHQTYQTMDLLQSNAETPETEPLVWAFEESWIGGGPSIGIGLNKILGVQFTPQILFHFKKSERE